MGKISVAESGIVKGSVKRVMRVSTMHSFLLRQRKVHLMVENDREVVIKAGEPGCAGIRQRNVHVRWRFSDLRE